MEERVNMNTVGFIILEIFVLTLAAIGWLYIRNLKRELGSLRKDCETGDAAIHQRINMINEDVVTLNREIIRIDEDIIKVASANKIQSQAIGSLNKRLRSVEYVTDKILKQIEEIKQKKGTTSSKVVPEEEMHEIKADYGKGSYLGHYTLTAYEWTGNPCANGNYPTTGYTVACNSIPLGTRIYIAGYGTYVVEDTGGMDGGTIDIYMGDVSSCYEFGVHDADVYIAN